MVPPPPRQHSRSSSLGSITNRIQPPAVPPREQTQNENIDIADSSLPPPLPPPPPSHPPITVASYPPPLPPLPQQTTVVQKVTTTTPLIYQQNQVENMVEQMHNLNVDHVKKLRYKKRKLIFFCKLLNGSLFLLVNKLKFQHNNKMLMNY